jgi:hypothetical protein
MNNNDDQRPGKKPMPKVKKNTADEYDEGNSRRVGGTMVAPSFAPMPMPFQMTGAPRSMQAPAGFGGASINTAPVKGTPQIQLAPSEPQKYVWDLPSVPTLPEFHPLERTAVFCPHTSHPIVAKRVSDILRERSVEASYDNEKAKVKCISQDGVDFRVRLYRGRNSYSHGIICEVQRRFGSSLSFPQLVQAILDAAEGKQPVPAPTMTTALPLYVSDEEDEVMPPPPSSSSTTGNSSLLMVSKMLSLPGFDAQNLGLQTLASLVDAKRIGAQTAKQVSLQLLEPNSEVGSKVLQYILNNTVKDEDLLALRVTSLEILANAMASSGTVPEFLRTVLRPILLKDISRAEFHTRTACCALACIEPFIASDEDTMELNEVLERALAVGQSRHLGLEQKAQQCIQKIR